MISYELMERLRSADYPLQRTGLYLVHMVSAGRTLVVMGGIKYLVPTLSELIEACGSEFDCVRQIHPDKPKNTYWFAEADSQSMGGIGCEGSIPEEAVADLWLALNEE